MTISSKTSENVVWHTGSVTRAQHEKKNTHRGAVVWLTGLPSSGKSTIAHAVEANLHSLGFQTAVLDGDNIRHGLCADLGFLVSDRNENVRRTGELAKLLLELGVVVIVALVSPIRLARDKVRQSIPEEDFIEVYCNASLAVCKERDPKGLYAKVASGAINNFTGVSSPYETPLAPELVLDTGSQHAGKAVDQLTEFLLRHLSDSRLDETAN